MTSPRPARSSSAGRVRNRERSQRTPAGSWNAPTRFLPAAVLMPVLPPTAASTIPSSVVGTCTTRTPRSQVAATKPPTSVVAPPPNVTTASERVKPASPSASQQSFATEDVFAASPSGSPRASTSYSSTSVSSTGCASSASPSANSNATRVTSSPSRPGSRAVRSCPTTTSYGAAPPTCSTVAPVGPSLMGSLRQDPGHLVGDVLRGASVGVHREPGHRLVDRGALVEQRLDPGPDVAEQQRPADAEPDPLDRVRE